ncbi:hypothetical protein J5N97_023273 [Dioscorea zingiberensis]|uniref:Uncharacterized protein n=1 Tax=Dioscorea zingiberensis TaxID=325984 RepID=A0A9D5HBD0_9LILI|nr:hypothetical protein J5N97_023273 [Dioscorea zingiberensis]
MQSTMITKEEEEPRPLKADKLINGFDMSLSLKTNNNEAEMLECECCGMSEDCTPTYIRSIKDYFGGKWVCGLCSEAVNEKVKRTPGLAIDEALENHVAFYKQFKTIWINPKLSLASAMRDIAKKSSQNRNPNNAFLWV